MSQYNEEHYGLLGVIIFAAGILIGCVIGEIVGDTQMHNWALDNGYAHFDQKTGELVLHEKGE